MKQTIGCLVASSLLCILTTTMAQEAAANCPIVCVNDSVCKQGETSYAGHPTNPDGSPFSFLKETDRDQHYCDCKDGWTGIRCGREFEICPESSTGHEHYCYHGGQCIDGLADTIADDQQFCDCDKAMHNGVAMRGKYCEHAAAVEIDQGEQDEPNGGEDGDTTTTPNDIPVTFCDENRKDLAWCFFGGTCKDTWDHVDRPCNCPDGRRGPHCEFVVGSVPPCDLDCENGGKCRLGVKSYDVKLYDEFWDTYENYQTCDCPDGYYGNKCEVSGVECGDKHCFNGATCSEALNINGATSYLCNCQNANNEEDSFAGAYCQSESTTFCNKQAGNNGQLFCTHGGTCKTEEHLGCDCPDGYHGAVCELTDSEEPQSCGLTCQNGGKCRNGAKDTSMLDAFGSELHGYNQTHNGYWEHCVCPDGFFGIQCEHQLQICPGGDHVCLHGSKCIANHESSTETTTHQCDCDSGFDAVERYAGKFCQYSSTDICTVNGRPGVGKANFAFCVNNGNCKKKVTDTEPHPGCTCPDGFEGPHCEFLEGRSPASASNGPNADDEIKLAAGRGLLLGLGITAVLMLIVVTIVFMRRSLSGKEEDSQMTPPIEATHSEPRPPFEADGEMTQAGPDVTDPEDLKTVEIL